MLEIIILFKLCGSIGRIVEKKGRRSGWYKLLLILFWFGGEVVGGICGAIMVAVANGTDDAGMGAAYLCALLGAVLGAFIAFTIAKGVPPAYPDFDGGEDQDRSYEDEWSGDDIPRRRVKKLEAPEPTNQPSPTAFRVERPE